ncbi:MAG: hypothetical protein SWH54_15460 [Thermodesulfobacteriota bacterium]|nr:hypothetical protein [Thermodesulfobacteriota bacterium]
MIKAKKQYAIELDGLTYTFSGDQLSQVVDLKDIKGDTWLITDMQEAISRTMTVDAAIRYVDVIVRKKLQELGEFDDSVSVLSHWKKKKGANTTEIFFTALPSRLLNRYVEHSREHDDNIIIFPLYSVLFHVLKQIKSPQPVVVVFQHNRFADLIIGTGTKVYYANRCVAFDTSPEQISNLWETVKTDIDTVERDHRIKADKTFLLTWIDSGSLPEWSSDTQREIYSFENEAITFNSAVKNISFLTALKSLSGRESISPPWEKVLYYTRRLCGYINLLIFIAALVLAGGYFYYNHQADVQADMAKRVAAKIDGIHFDIPTGVEEEKLKATLEFVKQLDSYKKSPSYKRVINDISASISRNMKFNVVKLDYSGSELLLEIFGRVEAPFNMAHKGYRDFLTSLKKRGYSVTESRFDTQINSSEFMIKLKKRIQ